MTGIVDTAHSLRRLLAKQGTKRLVVVGNSAGGYAALLTGAMLGADIVIAFSPETILDQTVLSSFGDVRWKERLDRLAAAGSLDPRYVDLGQALPPLVRPSTEYQVHYGEAAPEDTEHSKPWRPYLASGW